ncbi:MULTISPECIES: Sec-independent protein translocase protein TatB [Tsukamurella]|uniref:Sec-independent protein translocase protein TatB n=2 Tax=Tsukamurella TaxID=2060 RepID=A0A5C5RX75_9ACTN|nr:MULTISPECIES: Sec-independent protein translocase protein TatB [Tsukamurella]NMD58269.1 Sec-independent protein translocase subunit TatB [Tsukamurella columbiensis]TWS27020.1 Sec-independent protein translocase subunit TatB [Tsukamurella conjunctivitidis]
MFSNLGMGEILMLVVVGLVILGPERLPGAVNWFFTALRQVRDYATGATQQLKDDMGGDFDAIREPLQQIQNLRGMTPTAIVTKHLLNGDDTVIREMGEQVRSTADALNLRKAVESAAGPAAAPAVGGSATGMPASPELSLEKPPTMPRMHKPLPPEERAPFDPDAT